MADIAFLLIVFFMVSTTFSKDKTTVDLPSSTIRTEIPKNATIISVQGNGEIRANGDVYEIYNLQGFVEAILVEARQKGDEPDFILKIDKKVKYSLVDQVVEQLKKAKAKNICFPTTEETNKALEEM